MSKGGRPLDLTHGYVEKVHEDGRESLRRRNCEEKVNGKARPYEETLYTMQWKEQRRARTTDFG